MVFKKIKSLRYLSKNTHGQLVVEIEKWNMFVNLQLVVLMNHLRLLLWCKADALFVHFPHKNIGGRG